jgi:hypothetical protein
MPERGHRANAFYRDDKLEECTALARGLLDNLVILRYHRMKTLVLLASTVGDWHEANLFREDADALWRVGRRWHPEGEDKEADEFMAEIRGSLDELDSVLQAEQPRDYDLDGAVEGVVQNHDEEVAGMKGQMEGLKITTNRLEVGENEPNQPKWAKSSNNKPTSCMLLEAHLHTLGRSTSRPLSPPAPLSHPQQTPHGD